MQHEIEEAALKKEDDKLSQAHLKDVQQELSQMRDQFNEMKAKWENEKDAISKVQKLREELEQVNAQIERAERDYDLNKAAELKYGRLPQLKKQLEEEETIAEKQKESKNSLLRDKVTEEEIARIVGRWTGIPVTKLMEGEREKLLHMDEVLHKRVIGQDEAVEKSVRQSCGPVPESRTRTVRWVRSCSSVRPVSVKQNWQKHLQRRCSTMRTTLFVST